MSNVTRILSAIERGDARAADQLLPAVYEELRRLAAWKLLGMEQYKAGVYEEAVATLKRVDEYRRTMLNEESQPREIAYIAMALHRLGRHEEAKVTLDRLRDLLKDERFAEDKEAKACLAEAEKLIAGESFK